MRGWQGQIVSRPLGGGEAGGAGLHPRREVQQEQVALTGPPLQRGKVVPDRQVNRLYIVAHLSRFFVSFANGTE